MKQVQTIVCCPECGTYQILGITSFNGEYFQLPLTEFHGVTHICDKCHADIFIEIFVSIPSDNKMNLNQIQTEIKDTVKQMERLKKRLETLYVLRNIEEEKQSGQLSIEDYVK